MEPGDPLKHKNSRRLAWWSFFLAIAETAFYCANPEDVAGSAPMIWASYGLWAAIIGAYVGFSNWRDGWGQK